MGQRWYSDRISRLETDPPSYAGHQPPGREPRHRECLRRARRSERARAHGPGHHQLLHRAARLPGARQRSGSSDPRHPGGEARLHAFGRNRRAARRGGPLYGRDARRSSHSAAGRRGRRRGQALHRLRHPVHHRLRRRRRGHLPQSGVPDLRIANRRERREARADPSAREARLLVRSGGAGAPAHQEDAAAHPQLSAQSDGRLPDEAGARAHRRRAAEAP